MHKIVTRLFLSLMILLWGAGKMNAATVDFGAMELDTPYSYAQFSEVKGSFTAAKDGILKVKTTSSEVLIPYTDAEFTTEIGYEFQYFPGGGCGYELNVTAGTTYYFYRDFCLNGATVTLSMVDVSGGISLVSCTPEEGAEIFIGGEPQVTALFSAAVKVGGVAIQASGTTKAVNYTVDGTYVTCFPKEVLYTLLKNGTLSNGDPFKIILSDIRMAADESVVYGEDGTCELTFVSAGKPIEPVEIGGLLAEENRFLSYWPEGDEKGTIRMTFDGPLYTGVKENTAQVVTLTYGNVEGATGEFYTETIPYEVSGNTLTCDLTNKLRTPAIMVSSGTNYGTITVSISGVRDAEGNYAYTTGSGALGTFAYMKDYEEVKANITADFYPASGKSLKGVSEIELWVTDYAKLRFDGVQFDYENAEGVKKSVVTDDFTATPDNETVEGAYLLLIQVPEEVKGGKNIAVTLHNLVVADGLDHSSALTAYYDALVISKATYSVTADAAALKIAEGSFASFEKDGIITVSTNQNDEITAARFVIYDLGEEGVATTDAALSEPLTMEKQANGTFLAALPERVVFYERHAYRFEFLAYATVSDFENNEPSARASVRFSGSSRPYHYSAVKFAGSNPAAGTSVSAKEEALVTLTFDGMVKIAFSDCKLTAESAATRLSIASVTGVQAQEDGYSDKWEIAIAKETLAQVGAAFTLHVKATDYDGLIVKGNEGVEDENRIALSFPIAGIEGIDNVTLGNSTNAPAEVYDLQGRRVKHAGKGVYIVNGKKIIK